MVGRALAVCLLALLGAAAVAHAARPSAPRDWVHRASAARKQSLTAAAPEPWHNYTQTMQWFAQRLDHTVDPAKTSTWQQRTWVVDDFWTADGTGPIIHYLCGEYTCPGVNPERLFPLELAYEHRARVVVVEHRFYGDSQPFAGAADGPLALAHLKYLTSRQALADLAHFQTEMQKAIDAQYGHGRPLRNKWLVVGGSYPGALSAWYRVKYPELVVGSLASSGVVNAILSFDAFDAQVARSAGPDCSDALRATTQALEAGLATGAKALFGADAAALSDDDFLYFCADTMAEAVQYGNRLALCDAVTGGSDPLHQFANFSNASGASAGAAGYNARLLADPTNGGDGRSWWYQTCAEFGWFQVAPAQGSIRSARIDLAYHYTTCQTIFGQPMQPDVAGTNAYYGGARPDQKGATAIFFTNGQEDPWQWASIRQSIDGELEARVSDCTQCAHCVELYTPAPADAATLRETRERSAHHVREWLRR